MARHGSGSSRAPLRPSGGRGRDPTRRVGRVRWAGPRTGTSAPLTLPSPPACGRPAGGEDKITGIFRYRTINRWSRWCGGDLSLRPIPSFIIKTGLSILRRVLKLGAADKSPSQFDNLAARRAVVHIRPAALFLRDRTAQVRDGAALSRRRAPRRPEARDLRRARFSRIPRQPRVT